MIRDASGDANRDAECHLDSERADVSPPCQRDMVERNRVEWRKSVEQHGGQRQAVANRLPATPLVGVVPALVRYRNAPN